MKKCQNAIELEEVLQKMDELILGRVDNERFVQFNRVFAQYNPLELPKEEGTNTVTVDSGRNAGDELRELLLKMNEITTRKMPPEEQEQIHKVLLNYDKAMKKERDKLQRAVNRQKKRRGILERICAKFGV